METKGKWLCSKCGTVNDDEFEICFNCGALRRKAKEKKKPKKRKGVAALLICISLIVVFVGGSFIIHSTAAGLAEEGRYGEASARAKYDLIFSRDLQEDAFVRLGEELYLKGKYMEAIDYFEDFPENETAFKYLNLSIMAIANDYMNDGNYDNAINQVGMIEDPSLEDKARKLRNRAFFGEAAQLIKEKNFELAGDRLEKIEGDSKAGQCLDVVNGINDGRYVDAAKLAVAAAGNGECQLTWSEWRGVFEELCNTSPRENIARMLSRRAALQVFKTDNVFDDPNRTQLHFLIPEDQKFEYSSKDQTMVTEDMLNLCGSDEHGNMLVLWEIQKYGTAQVEYYIAWDIMENLPVELYPASFEEVGRVVKIECSGYKEGVYNYSYGASTVAVREKAEVVVTIGLSGRRIYGSSDCFGNNCLQSLHGSLPDIVFGGLPREELYTAVYSALSRMIT